MAFENTPNIVQDDNYRMFVKAVSARMRERGASVYTDPEAIRQERCDAQARAEAPRAYRLSDPLAKNSFDTGNARFMTTEDYLKYFNTCHDTYAAADFAPAAETKVKETKLFVDTRRIEKLCAEERKRRAAQKAPAARSFGERVSGLFASLSGARKRATVGLAAASLSLTLVVGIVFAVSGSAEGNNFAKAEVENPTEVVEVIGNGNVIS